jgi:hypothetical protein
VFPGSTDVASADEICTVRANIHKHRLEIDSILVDVIIQNMPVLREVQQLRAKKAYHLGAIAKHRGSISLALRAPDDVLALIFEHSAAGGWTNTPLVTSHVCAKWRRASLVPRVWSHIHLTGESMDPVAKTRLWLSGPLNPHFVLLSTSESLILIYSTRLA